MQPKSPQFHVLTQTQIADRNPATIKSDDFIFKTTSPKELRVGPGDTYEDCTVLLHDADPATVEIAPFFIMQTAASGTARMRLDGEENDRPKYTGQVAWPLELKWSGTQWELYRYEILQFHSTDDVPDPTGISTWVADAGAGADPVISAMYSGSLQVAFELLAAAIATA